MRPDLTPEPASSRMEIAAAMRTIWDRHRPAVIEQLAVLSHAAEALADGELEPEERERARGIAHRLAGSLGTFGLLSASEHAHRAVLLLAGEQPLSAAQAATLSPLLQSIAADVHATSTPIEIETPSDRQPVLPDATATVLIVEDDAPLARGLALEAERHDVRAEIAATPAAARRSLARTRPDGVLLDLTFEDGTEDALALLSELSEATPPIPVLVSTVRDELTSRVDVARHGGRRFVTKTLPADEVIGQILRLIRDARASGLTVLAVDDDPALLEVVQTFLSADGYRVITLADPTHFWQELERAQPDIILLDIDMPHISGLELCRVLRNDPRWATVPVLILTARRDAETIERAFAAGADDHLAKPLLPAELRVRIRNRVERLQLHRAMAETDGLTGIANRATATHAIERLLRLAARNHQPLALALLDLDHFKDVNDHHGHPAGDDVLRRLGRSLRHAFRGEDVIGRWGGEEFVVGMYGIDEHDASSRLNHLLAVFSEERFVGGGSAFSVDFSAGIACHPRDGMDLETLVAAADVALYRAKEAGRARVATTSATVS